MNKFRFFFAKIAIACAFYGPLLTALSSAITAYYLLGISGIWADIGRWASTGAAAFAVTVAAKTAHHVITTRAPPR